MKKRILFLAHSALRGGAEFCLDTTLRNLDREKIEPFVIFPTDGPMADSVREMGIPVEIEPLCWWMLYEPSFWEWKNRLRTPFRLHRLKNFLKKNRIDAVYSNTVCIFEGVLAARALGIPHFTHIHEVLEDRFMRPRWFSLPRITNFFYRNSQTVFFESDPSRKIAEAHLRTAHSRSRNAEKQLDELCARSAVVSNSSRLTLEEAEHFQEKEARPAWEKLRKFGIDPEKWTVLWLGRFSERKNPHMLLRAAAQLPESVRENIQFIFAGAGPLEASLRQEIAHSALETTCRLIPFQDDIRPLLRLANVLTLTSWEESFGLVLVEAGMFAKPTIAVRSQGPAEIIQDGATGFLTEPDDSRMLAEHILTLFRDPELSARLGRQNRERVLDLYDPVKNTAKIVQEFLKVPKRW